MVDIHLFIFLEGLITSSYCSLRSYDWSLAYSPISTDLEISNKLSPKSVTIKLALTASCMCPPEEYVRKGRKITRSL